MSLIRTREHTLDDNWLTLTGLTEEEDVQQKSQRQRLVAALDSVAVQCAVLLLVLLDGHVITALLLIQLGIIHDPNAGNQTVTTGESLDLSEDLQLAQTVLHSIHITLLSLFMLEILLRLAGYGREVVHDKLQLLDGLLVSTVLICYVALTAADTDKIVAYSLSYIILFRLWRLHRLYKSLTRPVRIKAERMIVAHRKAWKLEQEQLKYAQEKIAFQQREIETLREHLRVLEMNAHYLAASMTSLPTHDTGGQHEYSEDDEGEGGVGSDCHLTSVTVEKGYTPNGSLPHWKSAKGSTGSLPPHCLPPTSSTPDTPRSTCSNVSLLAGDQERTISGTISPTNYPDIVEDTQSADSREFESPDTSPVRARKGIVQSSGGNSTADGGDSRHCQEMEESERRAIGDTLSQTDNTNVGKDGSVTNGSERDTRETVSTTACVHSAPVAHDAPSKHFGTADQVQRTGAGSQVGAGSQPGASDSLQLPGGKRKETVQTEAMKGGGDLGFTNAAFDNTEEEDIEDRESEEELHEIRRVSQVPFHSDTDTYLNKEGIPMTDL